MPNSFAYLVLFSWPVVALILFRVFSVRPALIYTIMLGYLFLPTGVGIDLPGFPLMDKTFLANLSAALFCLIFGRSLIGARQHDPSSVRTHRREPGKVLFYLLILLLVVTPVFTVMNNQEPIIDGVVFLPGLRSYDIVSVLAGLLIALLPLFLGRRYLVTRESHQQLLKAFAILGLCYSLLMLIEIRLSPQLNNWMYGFFPHSFLQHIRGGGYRPIVFLPHGLWVGIFTAMAVLAATALWRQTTARAHSFAWGWAALWLFAVLFLAKSLGAFVLAILLLPVLLFLGRPGQIITGAAVAITVITYPLLRGADLVPVDKVMELATSVSAERAQSLEVRLVNENLLLERANEKPLTGWGGWGRNELYDPDTGRAYTITDGAWVILIGTYGWIGYIAHFGLLILPLVLLLRHRRRLKPDRATTALAMLHAINLIDLIPNATLTPLTYLLAGALLGGMRIPPTSEPSGRNGNGGATGRIEPVEADQDTAPATPVRHVRQPRK